MQIKIKGKNTKSIDVLYKYSKMKQRGVSVTWDVKETSLIMGFPKLSDVERLRPFYVDFIEQTLKNDYGLEQKDYEVVIK